MKDMKSLNNILKATVVAIFILVSQSSNAWAAPFPYESQEPDTSTVNAATPLNAIEGAKANTRLIRGDMNGDNVRSVSDVQVLVKIILGLIEDHETYIGDMNNNGEITVEDVMILVNIILGRHYIDYENPDLFIDDSKGGDPATGV